jgi:hypothetical protein
MSNDHESPAAPAGEPMAHELLGQPTLFPLAEVATRFDPGQLTYLRPLPTWVRTEMRLAVDPEGWTLRSAAEPAEYDLPPELHIGLQQQVPQALLRDLHRPVRHFDLVGMELREGSEWRHLDEAYQEIRQGQLREPLPQVEPLTRAVRQEQERRQAFLTERWQPFKPDDAPRDVINLEGGAGDFFSRFNPG